MNGTKGFDHWFDVHANNITLYGTSKDQSYSPEKYFITYDDNKGEDTSGTPGPGVKKASAGKELNLSSVIPSRNGYVFMGWSENQDATTATYEEGEAYIGYNDITLYAVWKEDYGPVITFNSNGGQGKMKELHVFDNTTVKLSENKFTNDNKIFYRWNTSADGSGISYKNKADISTTEDIILYAQWIDSAEIEEAKNIVKSGIYDDINKLGDIFENEINAEFFVDDEVIMDSIVESSILRNLIYDNAEIYEPLIASSETALNAMKNSTQYEVILKTGKNKTFYSGKAFVLGFSTQGAGGRYPTGTWLIGSYDYYPDRGNSTNGLEKLVNKFASEVIVNGIWGTSYEWDNNMYCALFKI